MEHYPYQQESLYLYAAIAVLVFIVSWWIVRRWWPWLRIILLSLVLALAFTPAFVFPDKDFIAPAVVDLVFDAAQHTHDGLLKTTVLKDLTPIALVWAVLFVLGGLLHWILPKSRADKERDNTRNAFDKRLADEQRQQRPQATIRESERSASTSRTSRSERPRERIEPEIRPVKRSPRPTSPRRPR